MKKLFMLYCFGCITMVAISQNKEATIVFKDGKEILGYGKLIGNDKVKFKKNKKEKAQKYNFRELKEVVIYDNNGSKTYVQEHVMGKKKPRVMERVITGKVTLYKEVSDGYNAGFVSGGGANGMGTISMGGGSHSIKNYYLKRWGDDKVFHVGSNQLFKKDFKKAASQFFNDCPSLVEKIQSDEFIKRNIGEIVNYYNVHCL